MLGGSDARYETPHCRQALIVVAALGAAIMSPARSLPLCLIGGVGGYMLAMLLF